LSLLTFDTLCPHITSMAQHTPYTKTTNDIKVSVIPVYLAEQSEPSEDVYVWAYTVQVENLSSKQVRLLNRHWKITDAHGHNQEVRGAGVVGEQPVLKPGEGFRYTSGTSLNTPSGIMVGEYEMEDSGEGTTFPIDIPAFSLDSPFQLSRPN
jgi:ApaG protein